ncbi:MAG: undecaprenyl-diphosphate phosphatase [Candidatus Coatesbacteria bacterium]|nr:undecaprenyl-diphosphate phosphatase [Candidatus Coatesbacteria bacterium]
MNGILFGLVQGLTEFLPISSSGHLAIFHHLCSEKADSMVPMGVLAHLGTLLAVLIFFRKDILNLVKSISPCALEDVAREPTLLLSAVRPRDSETALFSQRLLSMIVVGTIPAAVVGLLFKDSIEQAFTNVKLVGGMLLLTAGLLLLTRFAKEGTKTVWQQWLWYALAIGVFQAAAIMPGISRSGATIAAGLFLGLQRDFAARFSFLLSIPAIGGAFLLEFGEIVEAFRTQGPWQMVAVFMAAFIVGYLSIAVLLKLISRRKLHYFGFYCFAVGILTLALL